MSLYELIHEFLFDCKVRELSDQTITNYEKQLNKFRHFVKDNFQIIQFEDLKQIHVKQYISSLQDRGCKPAYINDLLKAVKCLCSYAQREGYSEDILTKRVKNVKQPKVLIHTFSSKEIEQAKKLNPRYLTMIIPSRWFSGGRGLDEFRDIMLNDKSIRIIHDFPDASDCFPGVEIKGGVCYFLRDRDYSGDCTVFSHSGNKITSEATRPLLEKGMQTFIRNNQMISILNKVRLYNENPFSSIVSANDPFGYDVRVAMLQEKKNKPSYVNDLLKAVKVLCR